MRLKAFFKKVSGCIPFSDCRNVVFGFFSQTPFFVLKTGKNPQWNKSQCCVNIEENCYCSLVTQNRRKDGWLMGIYLNPGNNKFKRAVNSDIYVDKTVFIPNEEIRSEYVSAIAVSDWADIVYVPRKRFSDKPALVVELKWDKNAEGAIQQIKEKEYCRSLEEYKGNLLLVGINYDKKTQVHTCKIEQYRKEESI